MVIIIIIINNIIVINNLAFHSFHMKWFVVAAFAVCIFVPTISCKQESHVYSFMSFVSEMLYNLRNFICIHGILNVNNLMEIGNYIETFTMTFIENTGDTSDN